MPDCPTPRWVRSLLEILLVVAIVLVALVTLFALIRRLLSNRLSIQPLRDRGRDAAHGSITATSVRESFVRMSRSDGRKGLRRIDSGPEAFVGLPADLTDVVTQARFVDALVEIADRLTRRWTWQVTGELRPAHPRRGVGLWVSLRKGGRHCPEETLWEDEFWPWEVSKEATQEGYDRLAVPAAAWLLYTTAERDERRLRRLVGRVRRAFRRDRGRASEPFAALGTADWRSYALSAVGSDLEARGDPVRARRCFERALGLDPHNRAARLSLAVADAQQRADRDAYRHALATFRNLAAQERDSERKLWYSVRYSHAIALLRPEPDATRVTEARELAVEVCAMIAGKLHGGDTAGGRRPWRRRARREWERRRQLRVFLERVEPLALLVLASALALEQPAVAWAPQRLDRDELRSRLEVAQSAMALRHEDIVQCVGEPHDLRSEVRYNLACYHVRRGHYDRAFEELRMALERGERAMRREARDDPVLQPLRKDSRYHRPLAKLHARLEHHPDTPVRSGGTAA